MALESNVLIFQSFALKMWIPSDPNCIPVVVLKNC